MLNEAARGVYTIAVTPFLPSGELDLASVDRMTDFYIEKGATGLTILGIMGEAGKLSADESMAVIKRVVARAAVPVIVGVSSAGFAAMQALAKSAMDAGAAGVMVAPTSGLRTDDQIINYYATTAQMLGDIPFVLQDFPLVTGVQISTKTILKIVEDNPTCMMLKHEDWPGLPKLSQIRAKEKDDSHRRVSILCGNGGLYLPQELARGADGAMTGFAYPEMLVQVCDLFQNGDVDTAEDLFDLYLPVVRHEQQPGYGLAVRKEILRRRGAISTALTRAPGPKLSKEDHVDLDRLLVRLEARLS
ncbi:dihydrodipicolinate synthase family protein [uncultured Kiloniella sp.]|uniref:dihydrodipicolinate synthase family protein n=1 Tax=uncultured Kiloniella sp. TaxID=1133091 RepID=UPI0026280E89|nr:dihydrodipicolinate synthase family protein [uncultured Kiloniella sp.]